MKIIALLISLISFIDLSAQVTYNPNVAKQFDSVFKKLSPGIQKVAADVEKDDGFPGSLIACTASIDDTLNLKDLNPDFKKVKIYMDGKEVDDVDDKLETPFPILILHSLRSDTLNLEVTFWIMSNQTIRHKIIGKKVTSSYEEFYKEENILRDRDGAPVTNDLTVPATTVKFVLSDKVFTEGKTIYGYADVITKDFLFEAAPQFKYNIMKHRFHFKYYFKIKLKKT